jgi:hypothetical protein
VLLVKFGSVYVLMLDETLVTRAKVPVVPVRRSMPKPSSLSEASVQLSVSWAAPARSTVMNKSKANVSAIKQQKKKRICVIKVPPNDIRRETLLEVRH